MSEDEFELKLVNKLPYDILCYIYEFRPLTRIEVWNDKYYYEFPFMRNIFNKYDNGASYDNPGSEYVFEIFERIFPDIKLHSRFISVNKTKHYSRTRFIRSTYTTESHINFDDLETEIFENMDVLIQNKKNHYNLCKLYLTFIVLGNDS